MNNSGLLYSDKLLTSVEIAELDFSHTDLVVLSACQTARGKDGSDGVFGLQRAFKLSGAQTIVMSLWPVSDGATKLLMTKFYENLLVQKMSKHDAFQSAVNYLRGFKSARAIHWAAFIMLD